MVDHDRGRAGHRLQRGQPERLHRAGGEEHIRGRQQGREPVTVRDEAKKDHREAGGTPGQAPPDRAVPGDHQSGGDAAADQLRQGVHGGVAPLLRRQPAGVHQQHLAVTGEGPPQRGVVTVGTEAVEVDAQGDPAQVGGADATELLARPRGGGDHCVERPRERGVGAVGGGPHRQHPAQRAGRPQVQQPVEAFVADHDGSHPGPAGPPAERAQGRPVVDLDTVGRLGRQQPDDPPRLGQHPVVGAGHQWRPHGDHGCVRGVADAVAFPGNDLDDVVPGRGVPGGEVPQRRADATGARRDEVGRLDDLHRVLPSSS